MIRLLLRVLGPEYARPVRRTIALMAVTAALEGLAYALLVPVLGNLLAGDPAGARPWLIGFGGAVAGYAALRYLSDLSGFRVGTTMLRGMYHRLGDHLARLPLGWYDTARVGEVGKLASGGVLQAMSVIAHLLGPFIGAVVTPPAILLVIIGYDWRLGLAALLAAPVIILVHRWTGRLQAATDDERHERDHEAADRVIEYLQAQPVLRAGGRTQERYAALDDALSGLRRASRRAAIGVLPGVLGLAGAVQLILTLLLVLGAYLALGGAVGVPELLAVLVLAARCADPLLALADLGGKLRSARSVLTRLEALLGTEPLPEPERPERPADTAVEFAGVDFRRGGRTVVEDVSFRVEPGERVAVVGPSGAGKTTLLHLLARFHDVDRGAVLIGGVDVRRIGTEALLEQVAIVFQDVYLLDGTIEDNVRLARPDADPAEVRAAAAAARLDEVVERLPDGWATEVGEGGARLSGGERQRVSIARALLKDAPIVLLDEVTSALDPANEAAVRAGLDRLVAGRTVLIVAHRLRTVQDADRIVFLDAGRVVEQGRPEDLLRRGGRYAEFWAAGEGDPFRRGSTRHVGA